MTPPRSSSSSHHHAEPPNKHYRAISLNPPRSKRSYQYQSSGTTAAANTTASSSQHQDDITRNYILNKMNHKIKQMAMDSSAEASSAQATRRPSTTSSSNNTPPAAASTAAHHQHHHETDYLSKQQQRLKNIEALTKFQQNPSSKQSANLSSARGSKHPSHGQRTRHKRPSLSSHTTSSSSQPAAAAPPPPHTNALLQQHQNASNSDPLMTSLISRLKLLEEKVKSLESSLSSKNHELKRVKKLGRHHKRENEACQTKITQLIEFVEDVSEYLCQKVPNHPYYSDIEKISEFAVQLEKQDFKMFNQNKEELQLDIAVRDQHSSTSRQNEDHTPVNVTHYPHHQPLEDPSTDVHQNPAKPTNAAADAAAARLAAKRQQQSNDDSTVPPTSTFAPSSKSHNKNEEQYDEYDERTVSDMPPAPRKINIPLLQQRINALNASLSDEYEIVKNSEGMSQFKQRKEVTLAFYLNGIVIDGGAFRPYEWDITKAFLMDILDGYFPFEFKEKYPNGVPLLLIDCSEETYTKGADVRKSLTSGNIQDFEQLKAEIGKSGAPVNKKEFLDRLPKQIVRDGKLINVRQNIASIMGDSLKESDLDLGQTEVTCNTECYALVEKHKEDNEKPPKHALLRLKIPKLPHTALETIFIYMFPDQTIGELRAEIDKHINSHGTLKYSIRCWPNVRLNDDSKTMSEAGLVPNATLFIHQL